MSGVPVELFVLYGHIEIKDTPSELLLQVDIGDNHVINGVQMLRFPFDVSGIGCSQDIRFLLVIEEQTVIFVVLQFDVLVQKEVDDVEFAATQAEKVFDFD